MDPPLSKNAQKRAVRATRIAQLKLQRRAREKDARREKNRLRAQQRAAGDQPHPRQTQKPRIQFGARVVIDLGFDHLMTDKEIISLCSQLAYTYSANRAASYPFSLLCTSLNGRTLQRLESLNQAGYKRWSRTEWCDQGFETLWQISTEQPDKPSRSPLCAKENVVYLTADAEEELSKLQADETYIIGGIVDHNRYKNLCQNKAEEWNIRTARLPIGRYLANLPTRKVLTVNQVLEILIKWVETRDWAAALNDVMPKRKFQAQGKKHKSMKASEASDKGSENQYDGSEEPEDVSAGDLDKRCEDDNNQILVERCQEEDG